MKRLSLSLVLAALAACGSTTPRTDTDKQIMTQEVESAKAAFLAADAGMKKWFDTAYGYAIFPDIGKGGLGIGGAHGRGQVFEQGKMVGWTDMKQATIGLQAGGQAYSEVIFFKDKTALDGFKQGNYEFSANASAVAASSGASATADYANGVCVFTHAKGGLMAEASIGGQKFNYEPN